MKISDAGLDIIKEFEGYKRRLPNGDCVAYRCIVGRDKAGRPIHDGKWTIGWGCTEGITEGTVWTKKRAEEGLRHEVEKHERAVERLVTSELNQNEFDALVSFSYNVGTGIGAPKGGLANATLLRLINAGKPEQAARQFGLYVNSNGVRNVPGLVRRRRMESALFLKPVEEAVAEAAIVDMPQTVDEPTKAAEHASAHKMLQEASTLYSAHGHLINKGGWTVPPTMLAVWQWASDPLHMALLASGGAFAAFVAVELLRLKARNKLLQGAS